MIDKTINGKEYQVLRDEAYNGNEKVLPDRLNPDNNQYNANHAEKKLMSHITQQNQNGDIGNVQINIQNTSEEFQGACYGCGGQIERPELIQGYTEDEIKQIEQKYNFPIHGQFKELLMTMGKCSGGILSGDNIYIYKDTRNEYDFSDDMRQEIHDDPDCQEFIKKMGNINFVEKKYFEFAGINEHIIQYFMLLANNDDIIYEWDTNEDTVREFGTLFDFLKYYRQIRCSDITGQNNKVFKRLTTGRLL